LSGLFALVGAWIGLLFAQRNTTRSIEAAQLTNQASIWQKANETELKELRSKLDTFYGPFLQMSEANHLMAAEFKARHQNCRILLKVFDRVWLAGLIPGDRKIVEMICTQAAELEKFIIEKAGAVDEKVLPYIAKAIAHFRILHAAQKGELGTDPTNFTGYVYPKALDGVLRAEMARIRERCDVLRAGPSTAPPPMKQLVLPPEPPASP
jgi:hypothetical protein